MFVAMLEMTTTLEEKLNETLADLKGQQSLLTRSLEISAAAVKADYIIA